MKSLAGSVEPILGSSDADRAVYARLINTCMQVPQKSESDAGSLYRYLDLEHLLDVFARRLEASVQVDGLTFQNTELGQRVHKSQSASDESADHHQLEYRIDDRDTSLGIVVISRRKQFSSSEVRRANKLVESLVGPLRNASLYMRACQSAYRDPLTGVKNRAALDITLSQDLASSATPASPVVLMVCDVDRFKAINDNCGHVVGDEVLRQFARALQEGTRESDLVFRYGGDEFVIALANTQLEGGREYAERIRQSIQKTTLYVANACINLTTTIGITEHRCGESLDEAFLRADDALLLGKREGKNRVVCH